MAIQLQDVEPGTNTVFIMVTSTDEAPASTKSRITSSPARPLQLVTLHTLACTDTQYTCTVCIRSLTHWLYQGEYIYTPWLYVQCATQQGKTFKMSWRV
jgi:hypothetical protein